MEYEAGSEVAGRYGEVEEYLIRKLAFGLGARWVLSKVDSGSSGHIQEQN